MALRCTPSRRGTLCPQHMCTLARKASIVSLVSVMGSDWAHGNRCGCGFLTLLGERGGKVVDDRLRSLPQMPPSPPIAWTEREQCIAQRLVREMRPQSIAQRAGGQRAQPHADQVR